jgi:SAM-dependent methyltransferase
MINPIYYISPHFLVKHYLFKDLRAISKKYPIEGKIIDIGCGSMPYKKIFSNNCRYLGIDFKSYSKNSSFQKNKPDYYFTNSYLKTNNLPFKPSSFDATLSFQVLEHHKSPEKLFKEFIRITKNGGLVIISFPLIWPLHEEPRDYYRFTEYVIIEFAKKYHARILEVKRQGSIFSTVNSLLNDHLTNFASQNILNFIISVIIYPFFLLFSYSCLLFDKIFKSQQIFLNYVVVLRVNK